MKKVVGNVVVVVLACLYLLAKGSYKAVEEFREEIQPIVGEIHLLQCILLFCMGIFTLGFAGVLMAVMR